MARERMGQAALDLGTVDHWTARSTMLRPLASVIRHQPQLSSGRSQLRNMAVGQVLVIDWEEEGEEGAQPSGEAWFVCPVCGATVQEGLLRRVGPSCSLCPSCNKALPI